MTSRCNSGRGSRSTETRVQPLRRTQRDHILDLLIAANGAEVSAVALAQASLQYSSRIKELRDAGHKIANRVEVRAGKKFGYFRLVTPGQAPLFPPRGGNL